MIDPKSLGFNDCDKESTSLHHEAPKISIYLEFLGATPCWLWMCSPARSGSNHRNGNGVDKRNGIDFESPSLQDDWSLWPLSVSRNTTEHHTTPQSPTEHYRAPQIPTDHHRASIYDVFWYVVCYRICVVLKSLSKKILTSADGKTYKTQAYGTVTEACFQFYCLP